MNFSKAFYNVSVSFSRSSFKKIMLCSFVANLSKQRKHFMKQIILKHKWGPTGHFFVTSIVIYRNKLNNAFSDLYTN